MRHDLEVSHTVEVNVPVSRMWEVLTQPEIIKEYLFGTETVTDWKPGSEIIFQGDYQGHKYRDHGVIQENILNKKISYTYWTGFSGLEDKPENCSLITYKLVATGDNKTEFTWTQQGFANEDGYKHSQTGMKDFLGEIKEIAER